MPIILEAQLGELSGAARGDLRSQPQKQDRGASQLAQLPAIGLPCPYLLTSGSELTADSYKTIRGVVSRVTANGK